MRESDIRSRLMEGNRRWQQAGEVIDALRRETARTGQKPYAIVIACSDSRVIPEQLFDAGLGELFVIRVAGNVLDRHQLGSVEYAAAHLHCRMNRRDPPGRGGGAGPAAGLRKERAPRGGPAAPGVCRASGDPHGGAGDLRRGVRHRGRQPPLAGLRRIKKDEGTIRFPRPFWDQSV